MALGAVARPAVAPIARAVALMATGDDRSVIRTGTNGSRTGDALFEPVGE